MRSHAAAVEASEEKRTWQQLTSLTSKPSPVVTNFSGTPDSPDLPKGGKFDHLLEAGRAVDLCGQLAHIFRSDPPVTCGQTNGRTAGLSCNFHGGDYARLVFSPDAVVSHLHLAEGFWDPGPDGNLLEVTVPSNGRLVIAGDTHGQLEDVLWMFFKYGLPSKTNQYLFNGDIVDRGGHALEIILLLFAFKRDIPESVHIIRGNHEDSVCIVQYGFKAELESKFPDSLSAVWDACTNVVFPLLPIAAILADEQHQRRYFVVHGGITDEQRERRLIIKRHFPSIERTRSTVQQHEHDEESYILFNLLWADPVETEDDKEEDGRGDQFTTDDTRVFCQVNGVDGIVRSHEVPETNRGVSVHHGRRCFTVFSASNYTGTCGNRGGVLIASGVPLQLAVSEHWAPPWKKLADLLPFQFEGGDEHQEWRKREARKWEIQFGIVADGPVDIDETDLEAEEDTPVSSPDSPAAAQELQFIAERIVEHKDELFVKFREYDSQSKGMIPAKAWAAVMLEVLGPHCSDLLTPDLAEELFGCWCLQDPVEYVRFLHRFQLRDGPHMEDSVLVDRIHAISLLQEQLVDFSSLSLSRLLDPDGDDEVTLDEFENFLPHFHVHLPPAQATALYQTLSNIVRQSPITLDSAIVCLALISQDPPAKSQWTDLCQSLGQAIIRADITFPDAFRSWDADRNGFLSLCELEEGLKKLDMEPAPTHEQIKACMQEIHGRGVQNDRVSVFEFVRAVAPRRMTLILQKSMIKEMLRIVWRFRPMLLGVLSEADSNATNTVSCDAFKSCLRDLNVHLEARRFRPLTEAHIGAICEIASAGADGVKYDHFLRSLHVEDTALDEGADNIPEHRSGGFDVRMMPKDEEAPLSFFWEAQSIDGLRKLISELDEAHASVRELRRVAAESRHNANKPPFYVPAM